MPIGATELIIILVIVLIVFGAKRVPELGRSLGTGMREFKESVTGKDREGDEPQELARPAPADTPAPAPETVAADEPADRS
ncbi:MAG TPA: twin-arginine translocase TatA/TatE family subunit [Thermoleophilaceae bacterium]|nr:twin-arginine translocase TatA/TatE family subunit [Thermoleophilaceae bacterium]